MSWKAICLAVCVPWAVPAHAQDAPAGDPSAETPAEALRRAPTKERPRLRFVNFAGGAYRLTRPDDDLYEAIPTGTQDEFEQRGYEVIHRDRVEFIVDQAGEIYSDRPYAGVIPGIRNTLVPGQLERLKKRSLVLWMGFQPMAAMSRIFWLLSNEAPRFQVKRVSEKRLEVFFPGAKPVNRNALREMILTPFTGPLQMVVGKRVRGGIKYVITLKKAAHYLYRYEAPFLFLDFEVDAPL